MQGYWRGMQQFDRSAYVLMVSVSFQLFTVTAGSILFGIPGALQASSAAQYCLLYFASLYLGGNRRSRVSLDRVVRYAVYCWSG